MENQWYELWMNQNKAFFTNAQNNLQALFDKKKIVNPEEHVEQIQKWMNSLKQQYQPIDMQEKTQAYWMQMSQIYMQACQLLLQEWKKRYIENNPINTVHDLYQVWLNCCHEEYHKAIRTEDFQKSFVEWMNSSFKWLDKFKVT